MKTKKFIVWLVAIGVIVVALGLWWLYWPSHAKNELRRSHAEAVKEEAIRNNADTLMLTESVRVSKEKMAVCLDSANLVTAEFLDTTVTVSAGEIVVYGDTAFSGLGQMFRKVWLLNQQSRLPTGDSGLIISTKLKLFPDPDQAWAYQDSCQKTLADTGKTSNPSLTASLPDSFIYDISQSEVALGMVKAGDRFSVVPTLLSDTLIWNRCQCDYCKKSREGGSKSLSGAWTGRQARTVHEHPEEFIAPWLPIGALMIKLPGQVWVMLDHPVMFQATQAGIVLVSLNDKEGLFSENTGKILIKSSQL